MISRLTKMNVPYNKLLLISSYSYTVISIVHVLYNLASYLKDLMDMLNSTLQYMAIHTKMLLHHLPRWMRSHADYQNVWYVSSTEEVCMCDENRQCVNLTEDTAMD